MAQNSALVVLLTLASTSLISAYVFPPYEITVYNPRGFKISIPDSEDLTLFAVHMNINQPMETLEAGEISVDVVRKREDRWVYENKRVRMRPGDKLYFWLYVIVDGLGYRLDNQEYTVPDDLQPAPGSETVPRPGVPSSTPQILQQPQPVTPPRPVPTSQEDRCKPTVTTVSGKAACKGEVIFFEQFQNRDGWGSNNNWTTEVQVPRTAESAFMVLDSTNRLVENGMLVMRPTLLEEKFGESFIRSGYLRLSGCTSETRENCESRGFSWDILPPVLSSRINTRNSFNFKYGQIEVRAKLPKGDWIVPEIWLVGKSYGVNSGRILLAHSLGNVDLKLHESNIGGKLLVQGLSTNESNSILFSKNSNDLWANDFHVFKTEWTPDQMKFMVDDSVVGTLEASEKLFKDIGLSNFAPFDTEFYLSVGIHVGGLVDFPDNSENGGKPKPWLDVELKNKLKFWLAKDKWSPTWGDHSRLLVDYIKVTAL